MSRVYHFVTATGGHLGGENAIEVSYVVDGSTIILTDSEGTPLRDTWGDLIKAGISPGQVIHPRVVASRLALRHWRSERDEMADFNRPLSGKDYPPCRY